MGEGGEGKEVQRREPLRGKRVEEETRMDKAGISSFHAWQGWIVKRGGGPFFEVVLWGRRGQGKAGVKRNLDAYSRDGSGHNGWDLDDGGWVGDSCLVGSLWGMVGREAVRQIDT